MSTNNNAVDALQRELIKAGKRRGAKKEKRSEPTARERKQLEKMLKG